MAGPRDPYLIGLTRGGLVLMRVSVHDKLSPFPSCCLRAVGVFGATQSASSLCCFFVFVSSCCGGRPGGSGAFLRARMSLCCARVRRRLLLFLRDAARGDPRAVARSRSFVSSPVRGQVKRLVELHNQFLFFVLLLLLKRPLS